MTVQVKVKNESLEWSLLGQNDRGRRLLFPLRTSPPGRRIWVEHPGQALLKGHLSVCLSEVLLIPQSTRTLFIMGSICNS